MSELPRSVGTIGGGNMAEAILRGLLRAGAPAAGLIAADPDSRRREHVSGMLGVRTTTDNGEVARECEVVVIAVKPAQLEPALSELRDRAAPLYVSVVAGRTLASLRKLLGPTARVVRAMPNTPALVGSGITAIAADPSAAAEDLDRAEAVLGAVGRVVRVPESLLDAVTGLSGSGPAYVYLMVESLMDAGVHEGLPSTVARELAIETVRGAGQLLRESGEHPAVLRERVTSPGGTTAAGVAELEAGGLRATLLAAVRAATRRSRELGRDS